MAPPLSVCIKEEQRSVILFLWSEGVSRASTHQRLSAQYGNSVLPQWSVYEWNEKFKTGRTNDNGAGRTSTPEVFNLLSSRANLHLSYNPAGCSHCRLQNYHGYIKHHYRGIGGSPDDVGEVSMA